MDIYPYPISSGQKGYFMKQKYPKSRSICGYINISSISNGYISISYIQHLDIYPGLEGNPGKIAPGGLLPDHPPSPLFNGDPALHRQCPGRVLSFEALSKHFLDFVLETTQMWASAAIWQNLIMATKKVWHIKPEIREKTSFLSAAVMSVIMT